MGTCYYNHMSLLYLTMPLNPTPTPFPHSLGMTRASVAWNLGFTGGDGGGP